MLKDADAWFSFTALQRFCKNTLYCPGDGVVKHPVCMSNLSWRCVLLLGRRGGNSIQTDVDNIFSINRRNKNIGRNWADGNIACVSLWPIVFSWFSNILKTIWTPCVRVFVCVCLCVCVCVWLLTKATSSRSVFPLLMTNRDYVISHRPGTCQQNISD